MDQLETAYIRHILETSEHNKTLTAERLGIDPSTPYRKLAKLGWEFVG